MILEFKISFLTNYGGSKKFMKELDLLFVKNVDIQHMFVFTFSLYCYLFLFLLNGQGLMLF